MSVRSTRPGNLTSDGSNELIDAPIDSFVGSLVDFDRLFDGIFNSSMRDRVRVEIAKHADMPSADRKSGSNDAGLVLVHHDDQLGFVYQLGCDDLRSMGCEVDVPAARHLDCLVGGWPSGAHEACGLGLVLFPEKSVQSPAQHRGSIRAAADIANAHEKDRRRFGIPLQAGHGPAPPLCVQQPFAVALHDA